MHKNWKVIGNHTITQIHLNKSIKRSSHWKIFSLASLPDAIATNCSKCTEKQRVGSEKVNHYLIDNQPDEWNQLAVLYDKDGEYKRKYIESKMREHTNAATTTPTAPAAGVIAGENGPRHEETKN